MGETENDDRPGSPETLRELYDVVPATEDYDAPPTPGQAQGMVEHLLDGEVVDDDPDQLEDEAEDESDDEPDDEAEDESDDEPDDEPEA
ncbi:hypothetical protein GCM10022237_24730 [Nocardioides ginsengisoli]|uniref:Uncharacterized protein n=1 Tax=Nocardioides ginsengisoli TaxID=363868 RepID=A0ABW3W7A0_9ACTN